MNYSYRFHPLAQEEYKASVDWYKLRNAAVARDFVNSIKKEINGICKNPLINKKGFKNYFEKITRKYPFTIIYIVQEETNEIVIVAIFHQSREPFQKYR